MKKLKLKTRTEKALDDAAAKKLSALIVQKKMESKLTQEKLGLDLNMSQSAISQFARGDAPIGLHALILFSKYFDVPPWEIREETKELFTGLNVGEGDELSLPAQKIGRAFDMLDNKQQESVRGFIEMLLRQNTGEESSLDKLINSLDKKEN